MSMMHSNKSIFALNGLLLVSIVLLILLYASSLPAFYSIWTDDNNPGYSHGPILLLVVVYLLFKQWRIVHRQLLLQLSWFGTMGLFAVSLLWGLARLGNIQIVELLSVIFMLVMLFWALLGIRQSRVFILPILLLLLAVPTWDFLNIYLRTFAAASVPQILSAVGIPAVRDGFDMIVPAGVFTVDAGCSGLNQFIVACVISLLYSYLIKANVRLGLLLLGIAMILAVVANILRITIVVSAGQLTEMQHYLVTREHVSLGWVVFALVMLIFFTLSARLERFCVGLGSTPTSASAHVPIGDASDRRTGTRSRIVAFGMLIPGLLGMLAGPLLVYICRAKPIETGVAHWPSAVAGWVAKPYSEDWKPVFRGADLQYSMIYEDSALNTVYLHAFHYIQQTQGKEAVSDANDISDAFWRETLLAVGDQGLSELSVREHKLRSSIGRERIVWSWYYVDGMRIADPRTAKIKNIIGILKGTPAITSFVLATDIKGSQSQAQDVLKTFLEGPAVEMETVIAVVQ